MILLRSNVSPDGCTTNGTSCSNSGPGCGWWGCWQYDQDPPGQYANDFVARAKKATYSGKAHPQIPMITYYLVLQASGATEGQGEVNAINNATFLKRYLNDFRFLLQKIGPNVAFLHIEPDFWGYVEHANDNPHKVPAPVPTANSTDCASAEASAAGLGKCMINMVRKYAPNAKVGLHASGWGTKLDVLQNTDTTFNVEAEAAKLGAFLKECGASDGDFVVADMSDRDAAWYKTQGSNTWWDATNATLPNFHQAFRWAKSVAKTVGKPIVWWQIPVGNSTLNNTNEHWKDNRVEYLFDHPLEVTQAHGIAMLFGSGAGGQTNPETDGGMLVKRTVAYRAAGGVPLCP